MAPKAKPKAKAKGGPPVVRQNLANARGRHAAVAKQAEENLPVIQEDNEGASKEHVCEIFRKFDTNSNGTLSRSEFAALFQRLKMPEADIETLMGAADKNKDGVIDFEEFFAWMFQGGDESKSVREGFTCFKAELTAAKEQVELCHQGIRRAERDMVPPQPVEIKFERDFHKLGMHFGKSSSREANLLIRALPKEAAHIAGVRAGWCVLDVDGTEVPADYGTKGGVADLIRDIGKKKGSVSIRFMPPDDPEKRRAAEAGLPELQVALARAQAILEELERPIDTEDGIEGTATAVEEPDPVYVPPPWVRVQYYDYREAFHAPAGRLAAAELDDVYCISDVMPGCGLLLAKWREGSKHLLDVDEIDSGASPLVADEDGVFVGLEAETTYFLLVQQGAEAIKKDAQWKAERRQDLENERRAAIQKRNPHDCKKCQVPLSVEISKAVDGDAKLNGRWMFKGCEYTGGGFVGDAASSTERPIYMQPVAGLAQPILFYDAGKQVWKIKPSEDYEDTAAELAMAKGITNSAYTFKTVYQYPSDQSDSRGFIPPNGDWLATGKAGLAVCVKCNKETDCRNCFDHNNPTHWDPS